MNKEWSKPKHPQERLAVGEGAGLISVPNGNLGIREGVKTSILLQVVRKWRAYRRPGRKGVFKQLARSLSLPKCGTLSFDESEDEEGDRSSTSSSNKRPTTPRGYLALYVGAERRRFLVKTDLLNHPLFGLLLDKAKEEFGFQQKGPLNIPCDTAFFEHIVWLAESNNPSIRNADAVYHLVLRGLSCATTASAPEMRCISPSFV